MKKMKWLLVTVGILFFMVDTAQAQLSNQHTVGARFGSSTGFTYRYALAEDRAIEGILSLQSNSKYSRFRVVGLYQYHKPLAENFTWYYGFGGSLGSAKHKSIQTTTQDPSTGVITTVSTATKSELALSIDGVIGLEYAIPTTPLSISLDVKPYLDFIQESTIRLFDPVGFSIRYKF